MENSNVQTEKNFSVVFFRFPQASVPLTRLADHSGKYNWITFNVSSLTLYQAIDQQHMVSHGLLSSFCGDS